MVATLFQKIFSVDQIALNQHELEACELRRRRKENPNLVLIDIREEREIRAGVVEGANWIRMKQLAAKIETLVPDHDREIVLYCHNGSRSYLSAMDLNDLGYRNTRSLHGGIIALYNNGFHIIRP